MNRKKIRSSISSLRKTSQPFIKPGLLLLLFINACSPGAIPATQAPIQDPPTAVPGTPTEIIPTPTPEPSPTHAPVADAIYPYYLLLTVKPDVPPQTINGVTVAIDWVYVDESRVGVHYTVSGLDWPDGSTLDFAQQVQISIPVLSEARFGGFSGGGGGSSSTADEGVIAAESDQLLLAGALDAEKHPNINVNVDIPVEGPTKVGTFHFQLNLPVANGTTIEDIEQTVVANNVSMTLKSVILSPSYAEALICFQMPSAVDWGLTASTITVGGREYPFAGGGLATPKGDSMSGLNAPERCNDVGFNVMYDSKSDTSVTITIPKLVASVNEVITKETVARANQRLAGKGIEFDYVNVDHGGNIEIIKRPEGATDPEIYTLIREALADQYEGSWVFTVPLQY